MWIKTSELQKGDKVPGLGIVESVTIGSNNRATIYASERNTTTDADSVHCVESIQWEPIA